MHVVALAGMRACAPGAGLHPAPPTIVKTTMNADLNVIPFRGRALLLLVCCVVVAHGATRTSSKLKFGVQRLSVACTSSRNNCMVFLMDASMRWRLLQLLYESLDHHGGAQSDAKPLLLSHKQPPNCFCTCKQCLSWLQAALCMSRLHNSCPGANTEEAVSNPPHLTAPWVAMHGTETSCQASLHKQSSEQVLWLLQNVSPRMAGRPPLSHFQGTLTHASTLYLACCV